MKKLQGQEFIPNSTTKYQLILRTVPSYLVQEILIKIKSRKPNVKTRR